MKFSKKYITNTSRIYEVLYIKDKSTNGGDEENRTPV